MTMLRPRGEAFRIAQKVVPGLKKGIGREEDDTPLEGPQTPQRDDVENKVIDINEAKGRFLNAKRSNGYGYFK